MFVNHFPIINVHVGQPLFSHYEKIIEEPSRHDKAMNNVRVGPLLMEILFLLFI